MLSHTEASSIYGKHPLRGICVELGCRVWCIHSKHLEWACSQAHPCTLTRRANPSWGGAAGSSKRRENERCKQAASELGKSAWHSC